MMNAKIQAGLRRQTTNNGMAHPPNAKSVASRAPERPHKAPQSARRPRKLRGAELQGRTQPSRAFCLEP
eukprot:9763338-Alexandrium_andersonii.AAC.1